jgi:hypothetical protein
MQGRVSADVQQAEYFLVLFDQQRAEVAEQLAHHRTELMLYEHVGDLAGVHRKRQVIRALEKEAFDIERIVGALWKKVAPADEPPSD